MKDEGCRMKDEEWDTVILSKFLPLGGTMLVRSDKSCNTSS
jgi:hypothetical protein